MGQVLRKTLLFGSAGALFIILAVSLSPITSPLPPYTGQYEVGILDLETEVEKREIHPATFKETGEKAFEVCSVAAPGQIVVLWVPTFKNLMCIKPVGYLKMRFHCISFMSLLSSNTGLDALRILM